MNYLVVGLGNPGEKYQQTRHNAGRFLLQQAPSGFAIDPFEIREDLNALRSEIRANESALPVILPETFMNLSGGSVAKAARKENADQVIIVHDDLDLPLGRFKISVGKGDGGHNGIRSVAAALGRSNLIRIRIGISRDRRPSFWDKLLGRDRGRNFVLAKFSQSELAVLDDMRAPVFEAIFCLANFGVQQAMNKFN